MPPMRNLLGRLHARRLPELLRIADAWSVPVAGESKGDIVGALYRAMTDARTMRDIWDRLDEDEQAIAATLADAADASAAPTIGELAAHLGSPEASVREVALRLYRMGILAREGDDEPLPIGVSPRLILPREIALNIRRVQDEMAAGDLTRAPLRVLIELLDDAEVEEAGRIWGMRSVPGVARRRDVASRLLRLVNDRARVDRAARTRTRDAAAIWQVVRAAEEPVPLAEAAHRASLAGARARDAARLREALAELEGALLVWHTYRPDGSRWLFVPAEIRNSEAAPPVDIPPLVDVELAPGTAPAWRHPDAVAWDLLTVLRLIADPRAPAWPAGEPPPRWLSRAAAQRFWMGGPEGMPAGYLELLRVLGEAEGVLAVAEEAKPPRLVAGSAAKAWRAEPFAAQTARLRERWLQLPQWVEGEPAGIVEIRGADWSGMRTRLLAVLVDAAIGLSPGAWVTLDSLAARIAAHVPALLGPSFTAATARMGGEVGAGVDEEEARRAALSDVVALELGGACAWFRIVETVAPPGRPRAVRLTERGARLAAQRPMSPELEASEAEAPLRIDESGEVTLRFASPERVWALSAFAEPVDLGAESHYRVTERSIAGALAAGSTVRQIVTFLERGSRQPLPEGLAANLAAWSRRHQHLRLRRALLIRCEEVAQRAPLARLLRRGGWQSEPVGEHGLLALLPDDADDSLHAEEALLAALHDAGFHPDWGDDPRG
jgi:hypothetical protein